jgi:hypothetical protein
MIIRLVAMLSSLFVAIPAFAQSSGSYSVEIDLQEQRAWLLENGRPVLSTPISSGRAGHFTETGTFRIIEKERNHFSNMYGQIVDAHGDTIVSDADSDMPLPRGAKFVPAPMRYFMRFNGAIGMHAGYLPGYPASHGCVRLPEANAIALFNAVDVGTPVTVFGVTPRGRSGGERPATMQRRAVPNPRPELRGFDPSLFPAWRR